MAVLPELMNQLLKKKLSLRLFKYASGVKVTQSFFIRIYSSSSWAFLGPHEKNIYKN